MAFGWSPFEWPRSLVCSFNLQALARLAYGAVVCELYRGGNTESGVPSPFLESLTLKQKPHGWSCIVLLLAGAGTWPFAQLHQGNFFLQLIKTIIENCNQLQYRVKERSPDGTFRKQLPLLSLDSIAKEGVERCKTHRIMEFAVRLCARNVKDCFGSPCQLDWSTPPWIILNLGVRSIPEKKNDIH